MVDGIASLIDNNLLRHSEEVTGEARIEMLQTIREFGLEQLHKSRADAEVYRAYTKYFATFAESAEANRSGPDYITWSEQIEIEHDNFRAALAWSFENEPELAVRITAAVGEFWFRQGHWTELRAASEKALAHAGKASFESLARCARFAGQCARVTGDPMQAKKFFEQSLSFSEKCASRVQMIEALNELGSILFQNEGRNSEARTLFDRAFKIAQELNDENRVAETLFQLGDLALAECDFEEARDKFEQAAAICRKHGYRAGTGQCMSYLAAVAIEVGEYDRAYSYLKVALEIHEKAHEVHNAIWDRYKRGQIASCRSEYTQAQIEFEECCRAFQQMSATVGEAWCLYELGRIALDTEEFAEASNCSRNRSSSFEPWEKPTPGSRCILGPPQFTRADFDPRKNFSKKASTSFANRAGKTESLWLHASSPIWTGYKENTKLPSLLLPRRWNWLRRWNPNVTPSSDCKRLFSLPTRKTGTNARPGCRVNLKLCGKKSACLWPLVAEANTNARRSVAARDWGKTRSRPSKKKDA